MKWVVAWVFRCLLVVFSADASAYCIIASSGCPQTGVGWPGSAATFNANGFSGSNATFNATFASAIQQWNGLSQFVYSSTSTSSDPCTGEPDNTQGWTFSATVCGSAFGGSTLAVAQTWANSFTPTLDTIVDSDIHYNTSFTWDVHNGSGSNVDFRRVTVHESGHSLGLGHNNDAAIAIMDPSISDTVETPQSDDINGLIALYGAITTTTTSSITSSTTTSIPTTTTSTSSSTTSTPTTTTSTSSSTTSALTTSTSSSSTTTTISACTDDIYETSGSDGTDDICFGSNISVGSTQTHSHCDEDWIWFNAIAGATYRVETSNLLSNADTTLALHNNCGAELDFDDDGGSGLASLLEFTPPSAADYDIRIREFDDSYQNGEGYDVTVTCIANCGGTTTTTSSTTSTTSSTTTIASTTTTTINPDDLDGDGIPNQYELDNGMNPNDPSDAAQDFDGDGLTNLEEYNADTDPNDPDTDGDGIEDGLDTEPLSSNNNCTGSGPDAVFTDVVSTDVICAAQNSISVSSPAEVQSTGHLHLVSPVVIFTNVAISGKLSVHTQNPCTNCP